MEEILIGKIVSVKGLKGEVRVNSYSDEDGFEGLETIILSRNSKEKAEYKIEKVGYQGAQVLLKLKGIDDRTLAEGLVGNDIFITEDELRILPDDTYYLRDLIGCDCFDVKENVLIGKITDVIQNSAQDIYEVELTTGNKTYIPAVKEFVKNVDIDNKHVDFDLIPGFIDDAVYIRD